MTDRLGQQLGNYQLLRLLGEGGFAEVYLGEHIHLGTQAAIKVLHTQLTSDDVDRFRTEARTIAHLIHTHIVRVLEFGVEGMTPFLVMDYAPNGTLRQRHPKGTPLPLDTILLYVKQIADALQYAHDEKVIHRDIKPENMLLGRRNEILLSDFGIAMVAQSSRYQSAQEMAGTMAYMAPEQIQGKPRPASDQYSLGIVVYEWLTGDRPFHGSLTELVGQHLSVLPPSLREKVLAISPVLEQVVLTALEKDPHQRFANVQAFAVALEQACQSAPAQQIVPTTEVPSSGESLLRIDGIATRSQNQPPLPTQVVTSSDQSSFPTKMVTPPSQSFQLPGESITPSPTVSPLSMREPLPSARNQELQPTQHRISRRIVVIGLAGLTVAGSSLTWLALSRRPQVSSLSSLHSTISPTPSPTPTPTPSPTPTGPPLGTTLYTYHGHSSSVNAVAWSPDGKRIASGSDDKTVQVWDAFTGNNVLIYRGHSGQAQNMVPVPNEEFFTSLSGDKARDALLGLSDAEYMLSGSFVGVTSVAWNHTGTRIASAGSEGTVQIWDAIKGGTFLTYRGHSGMVLRAAWSPDGKRIASCGVDQTVQVWDASTGTTLLIYRGHTTPGTVLAIAWSPDGSRVASGGDNVQICDSTTGKLLLTYSQSAYAVAWSPDGSRVASGGYDATGQVWDATTGKTLLTYRGHSGNVFTVAWSPDGKRIASGSTQDETVQIWEAFTGNNLLIYRGHSSAIYSIAWSPDGKRIASASYDKTVQVWQAS